MHFHSTFFDILTIFAPQTHKKKMKQALFPLILTALIAVACSSRQEVTGSATTVYNEEQCLPGDTTLYGLACEGCTDSLLVFLPFTGGDPDTFDILEAHISRKVLGRPSMGDRIAVIRNGVDSTVADLVINIDALQKDWYYQVQPRLRHRPQHPDSATKVPAMPDSLRRKWMVPREYGLTFKRSHEVLSMGMGRSSQREAQGPMEYPKAKRYRQWHIFNGRLILAETRRDTLGNEQVTSTDTADIKMLRRDTLVLRFADREQGYYHKKVSGDAK